MMRVKNKSVSYRSRTVVGHVSSSADVGTGTRVSPNLILLVPTARPGATALRFDLATSLWPHFEDVRMHAEDATTLGPQLRYAFSSEVLLPTYKYIPFVSDHDLLRFFHFISPCLLPPIPWWLPFISAQLLPVLTYTGCNL